MTGYLRVLWFWVSTGHCRVEWSKCTWTKTYQEYFLTFHCDWGSCALAHDVKHHFWLPVLLTVHFASSCWLEERRRIVQAKAAYSPVTQSQPSPIFWRASLPSSEFGTVAPVPRDIFSDSFHCWEQKPIFPEELPALMFTFPFVSHHP